MFLILKLQPWRRNLLPAEIFQHQSEISGSVILLHAAGVHLKRRTVDQKTSHIVEQHEIKKKISHFKSSSWWRSHRLQNNYQVTRAEVPPGQYRDVENQQVLFTGTFCSPVGRRANVFTRKYWQIVWILSSKKKKN